MKETHTVRTLYKLNEAEKNELQRRYPQNAKLPEKPETKEPAASEIVHTEKTKQHYPKKRRMKTIS